MEVIRIKKILAQIDPLAYAFIVLELCCDLFLPCPPYCKWLLRIKAHHEMYSGPGVLCMQSTFEFLVNLTCQPPLLNGCAITQ